MGPCVWRRLPWRSGPRGRTRRRAEPCPGSASLVDSAPCRQNDENSRAKLQNVRRNSSAICWTGVQATGYHSGAGSRTTNYVTEDVDLAVDDRRQCNRTGFRRVHARAPRVKGSRGDRPRHPSAGRSGATRRRGSALAKTSARSRYRSGAHCQILPRVSSSSGGCRRL